MTKLKKMKNMFVLTTMIAFSFVQNTYARDYRSVEDINQMALDRHCIEEPKRKEYLGEFTLTYYCSCDICNGIWANQPAFNGEELKNNYSVAIDLDVIPLNSYIEIEGYSNKFKCVDTGNKIVGNRIDIFVDDHERCLELGIKRNIKVWRLED